MNTPKYLIVLVFIAGYLTSAISDRFMPQSFSHYKTGYNDGISKGKPSAQQIALMKRTISGEVSSVTSNKITIKVTTLEATDNRTILINDTTQIFQLKQEKATSTSQGVKFSTVKIKSSDIKVGDNISVISATDIQKGKDLTAQSIQVLPKTINN